MTLNEGISYAHGNLGREWSTKIIESTGKQVIENALAYQPTKDAETIWCDLTSWESKDGSTNHFDAIINQTSKGSRVIVRGKFSSRTYKAKDGTTKTGWSCSVWDIATVVREGKRDEWQGKTAIVDGKPIDMETEEWF